MKTSPEINELAAALSKAQGEFTNPERNREVKVDIRDKQTREKKGEYKFKYTTLDHIIDMIRKPMSENGLAFAQSVTLDQEWAVVTTRIMHSSGQWIEDELPVKPDGFGPQQVGSAITYGKRYSLAALLGIASDEDDDGNLGSGNTSEQLTGPPRERAKAVAKQHGMTTGDQIPAKASQAEIYKAGLKTIDASASNASSRLTNAENVIYADFKAGKLTQAEKTELEFMVAEIQREINGHKQLDKEAAAA